MTRAEERDRRRREIAQALLRVAGERGLHAATMRAVAAEAGVSLHLVQHYFETKEQLVLFALEQLSEQMARRVMRRLQTVGAAPRPRQVVEAILVEALPTDEQSRTFHLIYTSYAMLAVTDPALAAHPLLSAPNVMESFIASQLRQARQDGDVTGDLDPDLEAVALLATSAGLGSSVLAGQREAESALAVLRHQLDRVAGPA
ncbi:TetR/AcrR family transcriptional regulator [Streptosporangium lutulentum]|uniref:AcrR family transcriptional regulator n=1 Tax=Streptosporangium lutulentum TaxID=1461250 RepID=A0ABT9Q868_9ACTN|nr:TetR/AcrR family transcriptional regulator [Streptosporangium lutulentum]MDP9842586.1 AcrR family transcriptional regulator [Streptosporangium lutulentum]